MITVLQTIKKVGLWIFNFVSGMGLRLTQTVREEQSQKKYTEIYNYYDRFAKDELTGRYINTKAMYEYKKCFFSVWLISIVAAFLSGAWKYFVQFFTDVLQIFSDKSVPVSILQTNLLSGSLVFMGVCAIVAIVLYWYICRMREMYRDLLVMEECLKKFEE